jgi:hypothetical protein
MTDSEDYWTVVRRPRWHRAQDHIQRLFNPAPPVPEQVPEPEPEPEIRHASEFEGLSGPTPYRLTVEEMVQLGLGYGALPRPIPATGLRSPDYQQAQFAAAANTSLAASPATTRSIVTPEGS